MEIYKTFDENFKLVGTATSSDVHSRGLWHETFHCWLFKVDDQNTPKLIFQLRAPTKKLFANFLDITAAGHLLESEMPLDGVREIEEELRLKVNKNDIISLGVRPDMAKIGEITNKEFCHTYLYRYHGNVSDIDFNADEVFGLVEVSVGDGIRLFSGEVPEIHGTGIAIGENGQRESISFRVARENVIPRIDRYYLKVLLNVQNAVQDGKYFAI